MKTTQKELNSIFNLTKGKFYVLSFNEYELRYETYGGLDLIQALTEIMKHLNFGRKVLILDRDGNDKVLKHEIVFNTRCPYNIAFKYSCDFNHFKYY